MELIGHFRNGVVEFDGPVPFREGEAVEVREASRTRNIDTGRIRRDARLPFVKSDAPGSMNLTSEMIHKIQEEEDLERIGRCFKAAE